jgi:hypothetical protein
MNADRDADEISGLLAILAVAHPNTLVVGPTVATSRVLALARPYLRAPIVDWLPYQQRELPMAVVGSLLIPALDTATPALQRALGSWLDARARTVQVFATSEIALWSLVERGAFLERLYYRLNQVCVDLSGAGSAGV